MTLVLGRLINQVFRFIVLIVGQAVSTIRLKGDLLKAYGALIGTLTATLIGGILGPFRRIAEGFGKRVITCPNRV